ncbi:nucleoside 2-deoxyribosyltransferase [Ancylobacter pratisalsi]|uniref:Nucleoside 2-deoxyribosyltransferase n=2 Tax=Ancylobacter pratisalsi TaxID=1745854 RepID=A0A6P1YSA9_9HYPH|nr:nucleoside 2-deoxyribosyltransferase [Ancylobacter pratisalsi]QIB35915.1 nucleoside 2-deoxyribosyltransferase [Ancylobacter pratisalsi]
MSRLRLYLAGPEVFRHDAAEEGRRLVALCRAAGGEGLYPLDTRGEDIRRSCIAMIDEADAIVANISPFRGHHMDPGTAFEIGYAEARGTPVFLWSNDARVLIKRIRVGSDGRDGEGMLVEDLDKPENLMIVPDGATVWPSPERAIAEAMARLGHVRKNRLLQRSTRRAVLLAALISLLVALGAGALVDRLVGW